MRGAQLSGGAGLRRGRGELGWFVCWPRGEREWLGPREEECDARARTGGVRAAGVGRAREGRVAAGLRFAGLGYWVLGFLSFILLFSNSISHSSSTI